MAERVESKNLFHYRLNGVMDEQVAAMEKHTKQQMTATQEMKEMDARLNSDDPTVDDAEAAHWLRGVMTKYTDMLLKAFGDVINNCHHTDFKVPLRDGNDYEVPVLVHTPKEKAGSKNNACMVYAHGGGVVAGDAEFMKGSLSQIACAVGIVIFNVDYRLAPETKCPKNVLDFYCAIKHIKENAESLGIDPSRICIAGDSGGGYICFGAMVMLAQNNETNLVKLAIPGIPMISDYHFGDLNQMTKEEREVAYLMRRYWKCIADDFDQQRNDPLLFPAKASDEIIAKMPPTIIWEKEFDMFITEAGRMANRMRRMGRLLEFRVMPGLTHGADMMPGKAFDDSVRDYKLAIESYLL